MIPLTLLFFLLLMIQKIVDFSIGHRLIVCFLVIAIIAGGVWAMKTISVDSTPDITNNQAQVITVAPNHPTEDRAHFIT